eukprot:364330-Chlamydomonas_euryale.AAC.1
MQIRLVLRRAAVPLDRHVVVDHQRHLGAVCGEVSAEPHKRSAKPSEGLAEPHKRSAKPSEVLAEPHERSAKPSEGLAEPHERSAKPSEGLAEPSGQWDSGVPCP